jgi:hypothetical protein
MGSHRHHRVGCRKVIAATMQQLLADEARSPEPAGGRRCSRGPLAERQPGLAALLTPAPPHLALPQTTDVDTAPVLDGGVGRRNHRQPLHRHTEQAHAALFRGVRTRHRQGVGMIPLRDTDLLGSAPLHLSVSPIALASLAKRARSVAGTTVPCRRTHGPAPCNRRHGPEHGSGPLWTGAQLSALAAACSRTCGWGRWVQRGPRLAYWTPRN